MNTLIKVETLSSWLNLPVDRIYTLAREGTIPSVRLKRTIRFDPVAIEEFIANGGTSVN